MSETSSSSILRNRWVLFIISAVHIIFTAGTVFGWAGLELVLKREGVFSSSCQNTNNHPSTNTTMYGPTSFLFLSRSSISPTTTITTETVTTTCPEQLNLLSLMFILGAVSNYLSNIPFGLILDRFGPKVCCIVSSVLYLVGCACFILAKLVHFDWLYLIGFMLFGLCGPGVQVPTFHLSNLFGSPATIIAIYTGLFDASTFVFFVMQLVYDYLNIGVIWLFTIYSAVIVFILVTGIIFWPNQPYGTETLSAENGVDAVDADVDADVVNVDSISTTNDIQKASFLKQTTSPMFIYVVVFAAIHVLRLNFIVATVNEQVHLKKPGQDSTVSMLLTAFNAILPFGFLGIPVMGYFLERSIKGTFLFVNTLGLIYGLAILLGKNSVVLIIGFAVLAVSRQFVYSAIFSNVALTFGYKHFGKLMGVCNLGVAIFGFIQYPLNRLIYGVWNGQFFWANLILLAISVPLFAHVFAKTNDGGLMALLRFRRTESPRAMTPQVAGTGVEDEVELVDENDMGDVDDKERFLSEESEQIVTQTTTLDPSTTTTTTTSVTSIEDV